jgi:hypothetical protein
MLATVASLISMAGLVSPALSKGGSANEAPQAILLESLLHVSVGENHLSNERSEV